jgi:hypothetical protein
MAVPVYVGAGAIAQAQNAVSVAWPAGHRPRDLALLLIECSGLDATANPSGWSHVAGSPLVDVASTAGSKFQLLWKRATSSAEAAVSLPDLGDHTLACITVLRGGPPGGDPFSAVTTLLKTSASGFASTPAIVTTVPNTLVVSLISRPNDSATAIFSLTNVDLTAVVERFDTGTTQGDGGGFALWSATRAVPGSVGVSGGFQNTVTTNCAYTLAMPPERRVTRIG